MNLLYPKIRLAYLPRMLGYAALGAVLAGMYGIVHDEMTSSISPEYFARQKFLQFHYADFGLPPRVFVAEIGFLASWWVGFFAAWFIARLAVPALAPAAARRTTVYGFLIVFALGLTGTTAGYVLGLCHGPDYSAWENYRIILPLADVPSFVRVAYIHGGSYAGGLVGLIIALVYAWRQSSRS